MHHAHMSISSSPPTEVWLYSQIQPNKALRPRAQRSVGGLESLRLRPLPEPPKYYETRPQRFDIISKGENEGIGNSLMSIQSLFCAHRPSTQTLDDDLTTSTQSHIYLEYLFESVISILTFKYQWSLKLITQLQHLNSTLSTMLSLHDWDNTDTFYPAPNSSGVKHSKYFKYQPLCTQSTHGTREELRSTQTFVEEMPCQLPDPQDRLLLLSRLLPSRTCPFSRR